MLYPQSAARAFATRSDGRSAVAVIGSPHCRSGQIAHKT